MRMFALYDNVTGEAEYLKVQQPVEDDTSLEEEGKTLLQIYEPFDPDTHYFPSGVKTERPSMTITGNTFYFTELPAGSSIRVYAYSLTNPDNRNVFILDNTEDVDLSANGLYRVYVSNAFPYKDIKMEITNGA